MSVSVYAIKKCALGIIMCTTLLLTSCNTNLLASSNTSKVDDASLEWAFTRADQHPEELLISVIDETHSTLDVAIYSLTHPKIVSALQRAAKRGVSIRIIADRSQAENKAMTEALRILGSSGIAMKVNVHSGLMHLKVVIADQQITTTGSFNFSKAASTINDDVLMVVRDKNVAESFASEFESMWEDKDQYQLITPKI